MTSIDYEHGAALVAAHASSGGHWDCTWHSAPFMGTAPSGANDVTTGFGAAPSGDAQLYIAWCGDITAFFWLRPNGQVTNGNAARPLAESVRNRMEVPSSNIGVRPDTRGVTGIPSLFWVDGAQPNMQQSTSAFGVTVTVSATLADVVWNFGDNTTVLHGGTGQPWPQRSDIKHNYRDTGTYTVTVTLTYLASFTASNGAGGQLQPIVVTFTRPYDVHEVQAVGRS